MTVFVHTCTSLKEASQQKNYLNVNNLYVHGNMKTFGLTLHVNTATLELGDDGISGNRLGQSKRSTAKLPLNIAQLNDETPLTR